MANILIIGGSGIVGKPVIMEALKENNIVTIFCLKKDSSLPQNVKQITVDRNNVCDFKKEVSLLPNNYDALIDIYSFDKKSAKQTYELFKGKVKHFIIISTTLVYDRSNISYPIKSSHSLSKKGILGGYADKKIDLELFWQSRNDVVWTIFRPYHIVGPGSLLGCLPMHNRDPDLLHKIRNGEELVLCEGGEIECNFIHSKDLAQLFLHTIHNEKSYNKCYNAINNEVITAKEYFQAIGNLLGCAVRIKKIPFEQVWDEKKGWELTTLKHVYDNSELISDLGFNPSISLNDSLKECISTYPVFQMQTADIPVHKRMNVLPRPSLYGE